MTIPVTPRRFLLFGVKPPEGPAAVLALEGAGKKVQVRPGEEGVPGGSPGGTERGSPRCTYLGQDVV